VEAFQNTELKGDATEAAMFLAQKVKGQRGQTRQLLAKAGIQPVKLEILKAEFGAGSKQRDVTAVIRKQAGDLPLIALPASTYNNSFGGDPLPGQVKRLRIQYQINGIAGESSFAEDAVILLPMPK
jgi:hypothetical protein